MTDKVVVVNGAGGCLGSLVVSELLDEGYVVAAVVRDTGKINRNEHENLHYFYCDFSEQESVKQCTTEIRKHYKIIYGIVNCVGVAHGAPFLMTSAEDLSLVFTVNYFSILTFVQHLSRKMLKSRNGVVVNISSTAGQLSDKGTLAYGGAKAALNHATKVMARELGDYGIRVNAIAPGAFESDMANKMDETSREALRERAAIKGEMVPEDVVSLIIFLLGDKARSLTGQILTLDRGVTC